MQLRRVELFNFRSHEHQEVTPNDTGITVVSGANGAGKSTILDSVAWALYGVKPPGVRKNSSLVREGVVVSKQDRVAVVVELEVAGRVLRVERRIVDKTGAGACDVWELVGGASSDSAHEDSAHEDSAHEDSAQEDSSLANLTDALAQELGAPAAASATEGAGDGDSGSAQLPVVDSFGTWRHVAGDAVQHSEQAIRNILKMDAKGFLAAVFVQQKQVDALVSASPKERGEVIEKLTGISAITTALKESRAEATTLKNALSMFEFDERELPRTRQALEQASARVESLTQKQERAEAKAASAVEELGTAREQNTKAQERVSKVRAIQERISALTAQLESQEQELESRIQERDKLRAKLRGVPQPGEQRDAAHERVASLRAKVRGAERTRDEALASSRNASEETARITALLAAAKIDGVDGVRKRLEECTASIARRQSKVTELQQSIAAQRHEVKQLRAAITTITDGDGTCPTCLQTVAQVDVVTGAMEAQIASITSATATVTEELEVHQEKLARAQQSERKLTSLLESAQSLGQLDARREEQDRIVERTAAELLTLEVELSHQERILEEAQKHELLNDAHEAARTRVLSVNEAINTTRGEQQRLQERIASVKVPTDAQLTRLAAKAERAADSARAAEVSAREIAGELRLSQQEHSTHEAQLARLEQEAARRATMVEQSEIATNTAETIAEFRANRVAESTPLLAAYASEFLTRFSDGKFVGVKIDGKFTATVVLKNGVTRPVANLSGGELSMVAIALRLGVSLLINGGNRSGMLLLDEILVSMDTVRSELILNTLKEASSSSQIVMIAHSPVVETIADKTISIGMDGKMVSTSAQ